MLFAIDTKLDFYYLGEPPWLLEKFLVCPSEFLAEHNHEQFVGDATFASFDEYGVVVLYLAKKSLGSNASLVTSLIALMTDL
jgi:phosphomevalonate kinase